ncbi:MAG: response regulator transcription factor [Anaerolineales bacterium]|nr:response regulator transcription factor [Anaerolineales bacterium]
MLVDDEPLIIDSLTYSLQREGFEVRAVGDGSIALQSIEEYQPNLVVLDIMLPGMSGLEICRRLRAQSSIPVIMLTARGEEFDRVLGLEVGADDYLAKPFSFRELLARIRSVLRRVELDRQAIQFKSIDIGNISLDVIARRVIIDGKEIPFSAREFDLLATLMKHAGQALSREDLLNQVWGDAWYGDPRTLDVHVRWLRMKIEEDPASPIYIQTVRGHGYRFVGPEELE